MLAPAIPERGIHNLLSTGYFAVAQMKHVIKATREARKRLIYTSSITTIGKPPEKTDWPTKVIFISLEVCQTMLIMKLKQHGKTCPGSIGGWL